METRTTETRGFPPMSKPEVDKQEESKLTMKNVGEVAEIARTMTDNPEDKPVPVNILTTYYDCFSAENLKNLKPRIARFLIQLQNRFSKEPGSDYNDTVMNEYQEQWDTSKFESKDKPKGRFALQLMALGKAAGLAKINTSMAEIKYDPRTPILFLINKEECKKIIDEDDRKKALESQNK